MKTVWKKKKRGWYNSPCKPFHKPVNKKKAEKEAIEPHRAQSKKHANTLESLPSRVDVVFNLSVSNTNLCATLRNEVNKQLRGNNCHGNKKKVINNSGIAPVPETKKIRKSMKSLLKHVLHMLDFDGEVANQTLSYSPTPKLGVVSSGAHSPHMTRKLLKNIKMLEENHDVPNKSNVTKKHDHLCEQSNRNYATPPYTSTEVFDRIHTNPSKTQSTGRQNPFRRPHSASGDRNRMKKSFNVLCDKNKKPSSASGTRKGPSYHDNREASDIGNEESIDTLLRPKPTIEVHSLFSVSADNPQPQIARKFLKTIPNPCEVAENHDTIEDPSKNENPSGPKDYQQWALRQDENIKNSFRTIIRSITKLDDETRKICSTFEEGLTSGETGVNSVSDQTPTTYKEPMETNQYEESARTTLKENPLPAVPSKQVEKPEKKKIYSLIRRETSGNASDPNSFQEQNKPQSKKIDSDDYYAQKVVCNRVQLDTNKQSMKISKPCKLCRYCQQSMRKMENLHRNVNRMIEEKLNHNQNTEAHTKHLNNLQSKPPQSLESDIKKGNAIPAEPTNRMDLCINRFQSPVDAFSGSVKEEVNAKHFDVFSVNVAVEDDTNETCPKSVRGKDETDAFPESAKDEDNADNMDISSTQVLLDRESDSLTEPTMVLEQSILAVEGILKTINDISTDIGNFYEDTQNEIGDVQLELEDWTKSEDSKVPRDYINFKDILEASIHENEMVSNDGTISSTPIQTDDSKGVVDETDDSVNTKSKMNSSSDIAEDEDNEDEDNEEEDNEEEDNEEVNVFDTLKEEAEAIHNELKIVETSVQGTQYEEVNVTEADLNNTDGNEVDNAETLESIDKHDDEAQTIISLAKKFETITLKEYKDKLKVPDIVKNLLTISEENLIEDVRTLGSTSPTEATLHSNSSADTIKRTSEHITLLDNSSSLADKGNNTTHSICKGISSKIICLKSSTDCRFKSEVNTVVSDCNRFPTGKIEVLEKSILHDDDPLSSSKSSKFNYEPTKDSARAVYVKPSGYPETSSSYDMDKRKSKHKRELKAKKGLVKAALNAYDSEMKPLKMALDALRDKIKAIKVLHTTRLHLKTPDSDSIDAKSDSGKYRNGDISRNNHANIISTKVKQERVLDKNEVSLPIQVIKEYKIPIKDSSCNDSDHSTNYRPQNSPSNEFRKCKPYIPHTADCFERSIVSRPKTIRPLYELTTDESISNNIPPQVHQHSKETKSRLSHTLPCTTHCVNFLSTTNKKHDIYSEKNTYDYSKCVEVINKKFEEFRKINDVDKLTKKYKHLENSPRSDRKCDVPPPPKICCQGSDPKFSFLDADRSGMIENIAPVLSSTWLQSNNNYNCYKNTNFINTSDSSKESCQVTSVEHENRLKKPFVGETPQKLESPIGNILPNFNNFRRKILDNDCSEIFVHENPEAKIHNAFVASNSRLEMKHPAGTIKILYINDKN